MSPTTAAWWTRATAIVCIGKPAVTHGEKPAVVLHGGPGSGCTIWHRRLFDPHAYRVVLFDQRGCGRSVPHASDPNTDLAVNTTPKLIADMERLRRHLNIDRWLVLGGSWGSTLALAYAESHTERVTEIILFGVTTGRRREVDWCSAAGPRCSSRRSGSACAPPCLRGDRDGDIIETCHRLLHDRDPAVRQQAAFGWCTWESAGIAWPPTPRLAPRFTDPAYAMAFARLVTHYVRHNAWLEDDGLLPGVGRWLPCPGS